MSTAKSGPLPSKAAPQNSSPESTAPVVISTTPEEARALDVARQLLKAGIPVFAAPPGDTPGTYRLPKHWEKTVPSEKWLDDWRPGWALAAVGGRAADFLDVDPRNGGDASLAELERSGHMPRSFGQQETPSGGVHYVISPTGERKGVVAPGLDLQSGAEDGSGRGFVYIAPTVRPSKATGELVAYRWAKEPELEELAEYGPGADHSVEGIVSRLRAKRTAKAAPAADPADPFMTNATATSGLPARPERVTARVQELAQELAGVQDGEGNTKAASVAYLAGQYVGAGQVDQEAVVDILLAALDGWTWRDPRDREAMAATIRRQVAQGTAKPRPWTEAAHHDAPSVVTAGQESTPDRVAELRAKLLDPDALQARPRPRPLVRGLLQAESLAWIIGEPGSFKSFVALDLAAHVGAGLPWRGREVTRGRVLYVAAEGATGMTLRLRAWRKAYGATPDLLTLPEPVQASDPQAWAALVEVCREVKPGLIVLDTQARVTVGLEENSAKEMGVFIAGLERLKRATGACVLVVHHTGRNGGDARGSSAIDGAQDTELKVTRARPKSSLQAKVSVEKQKDGEDGWSVPVELERVDLGSDLETGEALVTLALKPWDPIALAQIGQEEVPEWRANLTENQVEVMDALEDHGDDTGATRAQVLGWIKERRALKGLPPMAPTSFDSATKALREKCLLTKLGSKWARADALD